VSTLTAVGCRLDVCAINESKADGGGAPGIAKCLKTVTARNLARGFAIAFGAGLQHFFASICVICGQPSSHMAEM